MTTLLALSAGALGAPAPAPPAARQSFSLDGTWQFSLHSPTPASDAGAALGPAVQTGPIQVPGSWEAQGFGNETVQMVHQVLTGDNAKGQVCSRCPLRPSSPRPPRSALQPWRHPP